jgi:hypothetical protein
MLFPIGLGHRAFGRVSVSKFSHHQGLAEGGSLTHTEGAKGVICRLGDADVCDTYHRAKLASNLGNFHARKHRTKSPKP